MLRPRELWGESAKREFIECVESLILKNGGVTGLSLQMEHVGLRRLVQSWTVDATHEPISSEQLHRLFGTGVLRALAAKLNMQPREFVRRLASVLPGTVARLAAATRAPTPLRFRSDPPGA